MTVDEENQSNYLKYRGKCKVMSEALVAEDPTLTLVRGHYYDFAWGEQAHWWCVKADGTIIDPTALQFPSRGTGEYVPFNGWYVCETCGDEVKEEDMIPCGNYPTCSEKCAYALVM